MGPGRASVLSAAMADEPRLYDDLARWWPLFSAPADYAEEAAFFRELLAPAGADGPPRVLELGSGGGNLASHLKDHCQLTLCDRSPGMLAVSRELNPELEHVEGDMRDVRLGRTFDAVLIHDAVMYLREPADLRAALATAAAHCRPGGTVVIAPDCVRESFEPDTDCGGHDGDDGEAVRYLEWQFDPDPDDQQFESLYAIVLRERDGSLRVELDRHVEGLFAEADWLAWLAEAGLPSRVVVDAWKRHVFVATRS